MTSLKRILLSLSAVLCVVASLQAQLNRGSITGTVTDPTGAVIPRVNIVIQNTATNATYETVANENGQYTVPNLPIGPYQITFEAASFKKLLRGNIELGVTQVLRVDVALEIGSMDETIEVTAEVPRLQTDTPEMSTTMSNRQMVDVPFSFANGRLMENFTYKTHPGVFGNRWENNINGAPFFSRDTLLDGASTTTQVQGGMVLTSVSMEAVEELKVQTSGISAEFGRTQSGIYNYVLKSGSNDIHGSVYGSIRNEVLNGNTIPNKVRGVKRPLDRKQNYAFSFGGPVVIPKVYDGHNKTFFYSTFERYHDVNFVFGSPLRTAPQPEWYNGDFGRLLTTTQVGTDALGRPVFRGAIYDPATFRQLPGGRWVGDPFPGNRIPTDRFSSVAKNLNAIASKSYLPPVRDASGQIPLVNNMFGLEGPAGIPVSDEYFFTIKVDQIISTRHKVSGSFSYDGNPRDLANQGGLFDQNQRNGGPLARYFRQNLKAPLTRVAWDWTVSPRVLNHVTVSYDRLSDSSEGSQSEIDGASALGIKGLSTVGYPQINWNGGGGPFVNLDTVGREITSFTASDSWGLLNATSFSKGKHFMKAGYDMRGNHRNIRPTVKGANFNFHPRATAIPNEAFSGNQTGYSFASYLLGIVDSAALNDPITLGARRRFYSLFLQDDYKLSPKLTLNLGMRWEYQPPGYEAADRLSSWNPTKIDPVSGRAGAYDFAGDCTGCTGKRYFGRRSLRDWGPRVGFAYQPKEKWTIRGAWGVFYAADIFNGTGASPLGKATSVQAGGTYVLDADPVNPWAGIFNWDAGFPNNRYVPPVFDVSWGNRNQPGMLDLNYGRNGYSYQWNFNIQREVFWNFLVDVGYVGSKSQGLRIGELQRVNQLPVAVLSQFGRNLNNAVRSAADANANGIAYPYAGFAGTVASALRPFPQVQGNQTVNVYGAPLGFSTHHALQVTMNRQFSKGLTAYVNYVWSKTLTNVRSQLANANPGRPLDYYNLALEKAIADYDRPHFLKVYFDYELPFGRGKALWGGASKAMNAVFGGWAVSGILNYGAGTPLEFPGSFPLAGGWNGATNRANIAAGEFRVDNFDPSKVQAITTASPGNTYLNKSLFSDPAPLTLGTAAKYYTQARNFGTVTEDFTLQKNHWFKEKYRFQIRADFLNGFNRPSYGGIITTVTNPLFGQVTSVGGNRTVQFTTRLDF